MAADYSVPPANKDDLPRFDPDPTEVQGVVELSPFDTTLKGQNCGKLYEAVPKFNQAPCELVIKNQNNAWIVLGRDRPDKKDSGKGGAGETRAGAIDICVGRMGFEPDGNAAVDNNFKADAARIYISQRTDVDRNFALPAGQSGMSEERSAIAMRADEIRINARRSIKLVTGVYGKLNSFGQRDDFTYGIDLIAGGQDGELFMPLPDPTDPSVDRLQPLVKGYSLVECLKEIMGVIIEFHQTVQHWMTIQTKFNSTIMYHSHTGLAGPIPTQTAPDPILGVTAFETMLKTLDDGIIQLDHNMANILGAVTNKYLEPRDTSAPHYICSNQNRTN